MRHLGYLLNISPNTVARAYIELERRNIVVAKRGGGTIVTSGMDVLVMRTIRQRHLFDNVNEDIIKMLSQGYSPEELEAAFYTHLNRWRTERRTSVEGTTRSLAKCECGKIMRIVGSHNIALNILVTLLRQREKEAEIVHAGSLGGLIALEQEKTDLAGTHLLDEETGEYNVPLSRGYCPVVRLQ